MARVDEQGEVRMTIEDAAVRRRPRNRRQLIVDAAGPMFSEHGYHGASMEEVAARVGITAAALYRHFPNKYALFTECANVMVDGLLQAMAEPMPLTELLQALARTTLDNRDSGGIYRWEARFLDAPERRELRAKFTRVVDTTTEAVERDLPGGLPRLRASAALGAIGSVTMHRTPIARLRAEEVVVQAALNSASTQLDEVAPTASQVHLPARPEPASRRGEILLAAIPLFAERGYRNVSMAQIAQEVGLGSSAIYRHYSAKADILAAACLQVAGALELTVAQALQQASDPEGSLTALAAAYVAYAFENIPLISIAEAEIVGLPPEFRRPVLVAQREHVAVWEQRLLAVRPELDSRQARTLVHAGFGAVVEAGRHLRWADVDGNRDAVTALLLGALGVSR